MYKGLSYNERDYAQEDDGVFSIGPFGTNVATSKSSQYYYHCINGAPLEKVLVYALRRCFS